MISYRGICLSVCDIARDVAHFIKNQSSGFDRNKIEYKGWNNLVSYVDVTAEQKLIESLSQLIEGCGFICEEESVAVKEAEYKWIIDPLDGTTNFIHGLPPYCVSIALLQKDELVAGVIYEPNLNECFYAWKGGGAWLNDNRIKVSEVSELKQSLIATGFPYTNYERKGPYMEVFDFCMLNTQGLRRLGSAAVDLAYVACGRFEGFYEYGLKPWDVAAGALIIKEAGGSVSDFKGSNNFLFGEEMVATNQNIHASFVNVVKEKFGY